MVVIVGAGPTGLFTAIALARRGHAVTLVDRDPGPPPTGPWRRRGVMQFDQAHTFRAPVIDALRCELPDVLAALESMGAEVGTDSTGRPAALLCRRSTLERVLWAHAARQAGVRTVTGSVDGPAWVAGRVAGVRTDGEDLPADLVIDASGRSARYLSGLRPDGEALDCGAVYVSRQYRLTDGAEPGPVNSPIGLSLSMSGYAAIAFRHDRGTFSITLVHGGQDLRLRQLRDPAVFGAAVGAVPQLRDWIDPRRARPITPVLPGGRLYNSYRRQTDATGAPVLPGLISVGDAVCTTTPLAGRGVTLAFRQARALLGIVDDAPGGVTDTDTLTTAFDSWCEAELRPWFVDHRHADAERLRRWSGAGIDPTRPLPSDLVVAAADADPTLRPLVEPYARMEALPAGLAPARSRAHEIYARGWRPAVPPGPTAAELAQLCGDPAATAAGSRRPVTA
ncbi:FAD-dependent monooxygenase [Mycobacterium sp. PS03-16]|uniref:FAD-dependent oxidoreductase n=1 Tax=Mycobacterium sp. PS03-16 TaxID=2559611 RepID=UPI001074993E|nr:FAD-dependent oxidoreductase [Mycobacterium sp. PS03-16]TFV54714.1 FAD-dependent monooxygenase [Mycobacterium sp. PS03-16]